MNEAITLFDVVALSRASPEAVSVPNTCDKAELRPGYYVKLVFQAEGYQPEGMWVCMTGPSTGTLASNPTGMHPLIDFGDPVEFEPRHIIAIAPPGTATK